MAKAKSTPAKKPVAKKKSQGKVKVDWLQLRMEYLADATLSYNDLAKKYKLAKSTVEKRGKDEDWASLRQLYGEKAFNDFQAKLLDVKESAQNRHLQHYQNLQALANKTIVSMYDKTYATDKFGNYLSKKNKDGVYVPIEVPPNPFELEKLSKAMQIAINGERVVLGLPTSVGAITDPEGGNPWGGLADMLLAAREVNKRAAAKADSSGASSSSTE